MRLKIDALLDYHFPAKADVLLAVQVAQMPDQRLVEDKLVVSTATPLTGIAGQQGIGRRTWTAGEGSFVTRYEAVVDIAREVRDVSKLRAVALQALPARVIHYLWPSRYCQSDKMKPFACDQFGHLSGGARVKAIAEWTQANLRYVPGCSDAETSASDTFEQRQGICRDYAHLMISFCRALDIPARMVSAYGWRVDPPDFHAVVEVYLDGGWYLVDPTGLGPVEGLVRIAVGRDATDVSFMTIFGRADLNRQSVTVARAD